MANPLEQLGYIATIFGLAYIAYQVRLQKVKDRTELILKLSNDFFNNKKFQQVFELIDEDPPAIPNQRLRAIIEGAQDHTVKEIHLNIYFNFFNSIAILVDERIIDRSLALRIFRYQLEKTFALPVMLEYMEAYGFEKIKAILPSECFFYGTLQDPTARLENPDIEAVAPQLHDAGPATLSGYTTAEVPGTIPYRGLVAGDPTATVRGRLARIAPGAAWTELFTSLDRYEEVGVLYDRRILRMNESQRYVWAYLKR